MVENRNERRGKPVRMTVLALVPVLAVAGLVLYLGGFPRAPQAPPHPGPPGDISEVLARLEREAETGSGGGTVIQIGSAAPHTDDRWAITARKAGPQGTTEYTLSFRSLPDRWVCCEATAREAEAGGGRSEHRLGGDATDIDQLVIWLGWRTPDVRPPTFEGRNPAVGQVIPDVSECDVERIAVRDFGRERLAEVLAVLQEYGRREGTRGSGSPRVHLAILKVANGDFKKLKAHTENAIIDFRDVVSAAEYPFPHLRARNPNDPDRRETDDQANWRQYQEWLSRE